VGRGLVKKISANDVKVSLARRSEMRRNPDQRNSVTNPQSATPMANTDHSAGFNQKTLPSLTA
jgi:hypothetical protein